MLITGVGPYPNGPQAFHYASEWATHADGCGCAGRARRGAGTRLAGAVR